MMIDVLQGSDDWLKLRLGKATSSKIGDITSKGKNGSPSASRKNYMYQLLLERLTGEIAEHYQSVEMTRGIEQEQSAVEAYELETFNLCQTCGFFDSPENLMEGSSPDRLVSDDGLVEIKNPNTATHIETILSETSSIKKDYVYQIQHQLYCTDRKWADFVSYDVRCPYNLRLFIKRIERDEKMIEEIKAEVKLFLQELDELEKKVRDYANTKN
jgi:predicted phage-related endonuclease